MVLPTGGRKPGIPGQSRNELTDRILGIGGTLEELIPAAGRIVTANPDGDRIQVGLGGGFLPLRNARLAEVTSGSVLPIDAIGDTLYGRGMGGATPTSTLYRSTDDGATWEQVATSLGSPNAVRQLGNGEVFVSGTGQAFVSSGWSTNPLTASWTQVATPTSNGGANPSASFLPFQIDVYDNYVLLAEYVTPDRTNSRYLRFSTDYGQTFTNLLDLNTIHAGNEAQAHWHAVCIDPWANTPSGIRLWASNGDGGVVRAIRYSDDLGESWALFGDGQWQPTTMTATPAGIVCGTDEVPDGLYRILRTQDPEDMVIEPMALMRYGGPGGTLYGFATRGFYHAQTGLVYVAFRSDQGNSPAVVFASDGYSADIVYESPFVAPVSDCQNISVVDGGSVHWWMSRNDTSITYHAKAEQAARGSHSMTEMFRRFFSSDAKSSIAIGPRVGGDQGGMVVIGQEANSGSGTISAVMIGHGTQLSDGASYTTVVGQGAKAGNVYSTAVGQASEASGSNAVAVGRQAKSSTEGTAIGSGAESTGTSGTNGWYGVAIGRSAKNAATAGGVAVGYQSNVASGISNGMAVGRAASATASDATALGANTTASGANSVALGKSATASNARSIALGYQTTTTANDQVQLGTKHIEMSELSSDPAAPAENGARLFVRDNGSGKTQVCVRFATGAVQVLATEP